MNKLLFLLILLVIILTINSRLLKYAANTIIGKLVLLVLLISVTMHNTIYGLLIAILFITLTFDKPLYEGYSQCELPGTCSINPFYESTNQKALFGSDDYSGLVSNPTTGGIGSSARSIRRRIDGGGYGWPQIKTGDYMESPNKLYRFGIKKDPPYGAILMDVSGQIYWEQGAEAWGTEITGIGFKTWQPGPTGYDDYKGSLLFTNVKDGTDQGDVLLWTPCNNLANPSQTPCNGDPNAGKGNYLFLNDDGSLVFSEDASQNTIVWSYGPKMVSARFFTKDNINPNPPGGKQFWRQVSMGSGANKVNNVWQCMNKFGGCHGAPGEYNIAGKPPGCQDPQGLHTIRYRLDLKKLYDSGNGLWGPPKAPFDAKAAWDKLEDQMKYKIPFQEQHCQPSSDGKTLDFVNNGKILKNNEIKGKFFTSLDNKIRFSVNFTDDECNPCDPTCNYTLTHSDERILGEEKLRGENSSSILPTITQNNNEVTPNSTNSSSSYVAKNKVK